MANPVLWQFKYSHYNEKARWALDFKRVTHVRQSLLPGPHIPRVWFHEVLPDADYSAAQLTVGWRDGTRRLYRAAFPAIRTVMKADMKINDATAETGRAKVSAAFDRLEAELQPSGYLVGD